MTHNFVGKAVSIRCTGDMGVFQGQIKSANPQKITIIKAFLNGVPLKKSEMEVTIEAANIESLELIPQLGPSTSVASAPPVIAKPTPIKGVPSVTNGLANMKIKNGQQKSPVTVRSKPMEVPNGGTPFKNDKRRNGRQQQQQARSLRDRNSAFGTPVDDPTMSEEFDFEKNLALFDKAAIWDEIENGYERQEVPKTTAKFRHDENVISSKPIQLRQIQTEYKTREEFVTDEGLIIPCIPRALRSRVQTLAAQNGLTSERQADLLARGATEVAISLLGGARRLIPKNQHQWPTISIICDQPFNEYLSEVGIIAGRHLASHGLKVMVYVRTSTTSNRTSHELELFTATGNEFTNDPSELPASDLVILAVANPQLDPHIEKWISNSRSPILAIDPPPSGIRNLTLKCSLLPLLPLEGNSRAALGKLYLCNLSIPLKFFRDSGIKYSSPFGAKFVIPLHAVAEDEK